MNTFLRWGFFLMIAVGIATTSSGQTESLSETSFNLFVTFSGQVQPLEVTFQIPDETGESVVEVAFTRTATAVYSDDQATYWLTVPSALEYPGSGILDIPFTNIRIFGSDALVEIVDIVDNFRGFYALLRENQPRDITQISSGFLLPPYHDQEVGLIYIDTSDDFFPIQKVSPTFNKVLESFRFEGRDLSGFRFETFEIVGDGALGAPLFHQVFDAFTGEPSFILVGMLIESKLVNVPFSTETVINAPPNNTILETIDPALVSQEAE